MADPSYNPQESNLAKAVVEAGLATPNEVQKCLEHVRKVTTGTGKAKTLADTLIENGFVTPNQLVRLSTKLQVDESSQSTQSIPGYQILGKLGAGAMATVYKARQVSLDRTVAIKVLPKQFSNNPQFVERFYYEGRAAAKLNNSNIVAAYDVGKAGDFHYFVMEFVEGKTVYDDLQKIRRYKEQDALRLMLQIARALDHAHKAGFMHRDVKPKNIMITPDGTAKLADMGLARAVSDREAAEEEKGKAFGTPYYISPEQIRGDEDVDSRADIYGFGATLYHMVTGRVPFEGPNPSAVMHKHLKEKLVPPDHINSDLSSGIGEIIETCMAKNREDRYISSEAMLQDLEAVARGEAPLQARRKVDMAAFSGLETDLHHSPVQIGAVRDGQIAQLKLLAVLGWGAAGLLLVVMVMMMLLKSH